MVQRGKVQTKGSSIKSRGNTAAVSSRYHTRSSQPEIDDEMDEDDENGLDFITGNENDDASDEDEDEVYANNDEDEDSNDENDEDEDEDDDDDDLNNIVDNLPAKLRQKVLMGGSSADDDDDLIDDDEEEEENYDRWGKKKTYWTGDTADLEIGQDVQDAEDEEKAAMVCLLILNNWLYMYIHTLFITHTFLSHIY